MLGDYRQTRLSEYSRIYDILIPRDHIFRRMNEEIDFSFVRKELEKKYSAGMGRSAEDPVRMFKYLMLKAIHPASDEDLVKRAYTDMSYKFFLGLNPEDDVIDPSLLSKFRRQRLQDVDLLSLLISTVGTVGTTQLCRAAFPNAGITESDVWSCARTRRAERLHNSLLPRCAEWLYGISGIRTGHRLCTVLRTYRV